MLKQSPEQTETAKAASNARSAADVAMAAPLSDMKKSAASQNELLKRNVARGLSGKLLLLTMAFVMIAEILILVPSIANHRNVWLQWHVDTAESASIVYLDSSNTMLSEMAQAELLAATQSHSVSIRESGINRLMASKPINGQVQEHINLGEMSMLSMIKSAFGTLFFGGERTYHVFTKMKSRDAEIHLVQEDKHLRNAMWRYAINILLISLGISLFTAGLVFVSLYMLIVKPIINLSENMGNFSKNPENAALIFQPSGRADEIGTTERRLSVLQSELQATLRQKKHLADLGLAVSKINHDLRNILASAQLFTDRLVTIDDPTAQKFAPKLIRTIDRAVEYTREVLAYGKATESPPQLRVQRLHTLVEDVGDTLGFGQPDKDYKIEWINGVDHEHFVHADSEQLFRAILNISRNAVQVLENDSEQSAVKRLEISASFEGTTSLIRIKDTGPGISPHQQENLFSAFQGSTRPGGTGLGLAIAAELVRAHGGSIEIENSNSMGSVFLIKLPSHNG